LLAATPEIFSGGENMGLLDDVVNAAGGGQGQSNNAMLGHVLDMIKNHPGGVTGLIDSFHQNGLGGLVSSWIGTGQNLPISADQIQSVLGSGQIASLAAKAGITPDQASAEISKLLPQVMDKLSPNGQLPQGGGMLEAAMGMLKGKL
jgi:uncharacterized protein YidB (DUF937 family)